MRYLVRVMLFALAMVVAGSSLRAEVVSGYTCTTDTNRNLWLDMGDAYQTSPYQTNIPLPFHFQFMGYGYDHVWFSPEGRLNWGRRVLMAGTLPSHIVFYDDLLAINTAYQPSRFVKWKVIGTEGNREVVFELGLVINWYNGIPDYTRFLQVRLSEADGSIVVIFQPETDPSEVRGRLALKGEGGESISTNGIDFLADESTRFTWPPSYRYYSFTPASTSRCLGVGDVGLSPLSDARALLSWSPVAGAAAYRVEYKDSASNTYVTFTTSDTMVVIPEVVAHSYYCCRVTVICEGGGESRTFRTFFHTDCFVENPGLAYWNLTDTNVTCYHGLVDSPFENISVVDSGASSYLSRHTVHYDFEETDGITFEQLHTVPFGYCCSVRLGNHLPEESEAISYTVQIDTNELSLILLTYALVEQKPNHDPIAMPKFELKITDLNDSVVNDCYNVRLVSGSDDTCWHDAGAWNWTYWQNVGLDVSAYHGMTIKITLINYDCALGAHGGYVYFAMRSERKTIHTALCGESVSTELRAPAGFRYRWYRTDNPSVTLSNSQSVLVSDVGNYSCECIFAFDSNCSFVLRTNVTPQYPKAVFTYDSTRLNVCDYEFRFHNQSTITTDANLTLPLYEHCESYLWLFDDGTISGDTNVTHVFHPGSHWAELRAYLGGGICSDSYRVTFDIPFGHEVVDDSVCDGGVYRLCGREFDEPGTYQVRDRCIDYTLNLTSFHYSHQEIEETICSGDAYVLGGTSYDAEGYHAATLTAANGCDSTFGITLHLRPLPSAEYELFHSCRDEAYYYYTAHLRLADSAYQVAGTQTYFTDDSTLIRWQPAFDSDPMPYFGDDGLLRLDVDTVHKYVIYYSYHDMPQCPVIDTFIAVPAEELVANVQVSPEFLTADGLDFMALDISSNNESRLWIINGELQAETERRLYASARPDVDSVVVKLVAFNRSCQDSVERVIPVLRHQLLFPNVFTPALGINNTFGPASTNIHDFEMWIYDRQGHQVFHSTDVHESWDGTSQGHRCVQGTYVYVCEYFTQEYGKNRQVGTVTLLR